MYIPKSKILENQYTNGREFILIEDEQPYIGYYHTISDRVYFTGRTTKDKNKRQLKKVLNTQEETNNFLAPYYPQPTESDYKVGFMTRYFMKRRTDDYTKIVEISPNDYNRNFKIMNGELDTNMYVAVKLNWKITGPLNNNFQDPNFPKPGIIETNKKLVQLKEPVMPGFSLFITDYAKFAK